MAAVDNAKQKLDEACFYLSLMDKIEMERSALTKGRSSTEEFSYLLSAFLNACYSCTEYLKHVKSITDNVKEFRHRHSDFYGSGPNGGWRTQAVHFKPVTPAHDGYIPPPGDNIIMRFRDQRPYTPPKGNAVNFDFGAEAGTFYFSNEGYQNSICDVCAVHIGEIREFIQAATNS